MELLEIDDSGAVPQPNVMGEYAPRHIPDLRVRADLKPLEITQPEGASFTLDGRLLRWQRWTMRIGFTPREGLVLHRVGYEQDGEPRPIAHRMSFAEMVVPYRDPTPDHYRRTAFDIGEWGMGFMTTSLALGCDCLGEITYVDEVVHDSHGNPLTIPRRSASTRRTTPSCGSTWTRHRHRGAPHAPAGGVVPRHGRQLRVPRVLAVPRGRQHRV